MGPSKGAGRASCLAVNPTNLEDSARRRVRLLAAFDALTEDERADLLEEAETLAFSESFRMTSLDRADARAMFRKVYTRAGWEIPDAELAEAVTAYQDCPPGTGAEERLAEALRAIGGDPELAGVAYAEFDPRGAGSVAKAMLAALAAVARRGRVSGDA